VSAGGHGITSLYFGFGPAAGHGAGCSKQGSDDWEVTRHLDKRYDGQVRRTTLRYACHQCGVVVFEVFDGPAASFVTSRASETGYGSRPERVAGLWLWPGPAIWPGDERGPASYYVTRGKDRPREPGHVAAVIGGHLGPRGGVRWAAGLEPTGHGTVTSRSEQDFASRRAAAVWVARQLRSDVP
jgi:hypothetical protein